MRACYTLVRPTSLAGPRLWQDQILKGAPSSATIADEKTIGSVGIVIECDNSIPATPLYIWRINRNERLAAA